MFVYPLTRTVARSSLVPQIGRVLDDSFDRFFGNAAVARNVRSPALDVLETGSHFLVSFDVPGVTREQLKVSVEGRRVAIESTELPKPAEAAVEGEAPKAEPVVDTPRALYRERSTARYARTVVLPAEVDQSASQARFDDGVLTLTLAKKVPAGATQLTIG